MNDSNIALIVAAISAIFGAAGGLSGLAAFYSAKSAARRNKAEVERIKAEAAKLQAETARSEVGSMADLVAGAAAEMIGDLREQGKFNADRIISLEERNEEEHRLVVILQREGKQLQAMLDKALHRIDILECAARKKDAIIGVLQTENKSLKVANETLERELLKLQTMLTEAFQRIDELQQRN